MWSENTGFDYVINSGGDWSTFGSGFASGAVSSLLASGFQSAGARFNFSENLIKVGMVAVGGLSGGLSSVIAGGNFWDGMREGLIVAGLNHLGGKIFRKGTTPPKKGRTAGENKTNGQQPPTERTLIVRHGMT